MAETLFVHPGKLHYLVREIFKRLRVPPKDASTIAEAVVAADLAGVESQGAARVPFYVDRLSARLVNPTPEIKVVQETAAAATIDGDNGPGPVVGAKAMELAIMKAGRNGVAAVAVRKSNQLGMLGYYARMALPEKMAGIAMTNDVPAVAPPGGSSPFHGVNPAAIAIPGKEDKSPFVLDFTGREVDSGRQRAEMGLAVEILCGILSEGSFGPELSGAEGDHPEVAHIGHFFAAIQIEAFGPWLRFRNRIDEMLKKLKASSGSSVYYPGEPEYQAEEDRRANGIPIPGPVASRLEGVARGLGLRDAWDQLLATRKQQD